MSSAVCCKETTCGWRYKGRVRLCGNGPESRCLVQPSHRKIPGTGIRGTKVEWKAIEDFELEL